MKLTDCFGCPACKDGKCKNKPYLNNIRKVDYKVITQIEKCPKDKDK